MCPLDTLESSLERVLGRAQEKRAGEARWRVAGERLECDWLAWSAAAERAEKLESTEQPEERAGERWGEHQGEHCRARWRSALESG